MCLHIESREARNDTLISGIQPRNQENCQSCKQRELTSQNQAKVKAGMPDYMKASLKASSYSGILGGRP
ncbi:hypothetical protein [Chryseobacterium sp. 52]|uniref:hypothetical protein n=1 Tax=Chryseobacterium sp. 52 TaxID=2035213 RepID=UPI00117EF6C5|nr:hypothetical protein [Chryseobacterium sp. 52]